MIRLAAFSIAALFATAAAASANEWTPYGYTCGDIVKAKQTKDLNAAFGVGFAYNYMLGQTHQAVLAAGKRITKAGTKTAVDTVINKCSVGEAREDMSIIEMGHIAGLAAVGTAEDR